VRGAGFGRDGIGSSFACHVTRRSVIARGISIDPAGDSAG